MHALRNNEDQQSNACNDHHTQHPTPNKDPKEVAEPLQNIHACNDASGNGYMALQWL